MQSIVKRLMFFALAALVPATEEMQVLRSQLVRVLLLAGVGMQRVRQGCTLALLAAAFSFQAGAQPSWVQQFPAASPDYREASWMTWDGLHKQVVLFGGCTASSCPSADTWTWDGKTWTPMFSAVSPPARFRHCMMYDPGHEQVVLFGGEGENGFLNDTWVWDGSTWMQKSTAGAPIAQDCYASLAYDERHQQAIFFGKAAANSTASATWSWDGTNWSRLYPSTAPPYGATPILVYDKGRQQLVLATYTDNPANNNYASTWTWDGANWNRITETGLLPSDQNPSEGVYDPVTKQILVFLEGPSVYGWNGAGWFPVSTAVEPPDRILPAMAFDEVNQQVVMFGGSGSGPSALANDTWTYGYPTLDWTQLAPNSMPSARGFVAMAFDGENNNTVLFGGLSSGPSYLSDTWTWDGSNWLQMSPSQSPPGRALPAMAYDGRNREVVLFGGFGPAGPVGGYYGDTWIWNGSNWSQKTPAHSPPAQAYHSMTFDTALQQVVLFSGMTCCNAAVSGDTWTWDGTDWTHQLPTTTPPETFAYSAAAFDGARGTTLRFDSFYQSPKWNASTWIYNGATWNNLSPTHTPGARILDSTLAYDSQRQQISLFGGSDSNTGANLSDTWLWSGFDWTQIAPPHNPSARGGFGYAFDPIHNNTVLFGGRYNGASEVYYNDTWILGPPSQGGATVAINVPAGVQFFFNGQSYTGSQTIPIAPGSYTLYAASPQTIATGTQATFASWSDGGAQSHLVTVAAGGLSITGTFNTSYLLTTVANPSAGGTVSGGGYYLSGTGATVTATPNANYLFGSWSGACSGSGACSVTMNAPATVTANFTLNVVQYTVTVPASVQFTFNGTTYTGPQTLTVAPGSYTLSTTTPQATAAGTQAVFQSWSDGGAISHPVTLSLGPAQTVTGVFTTQYLLTTAALPAGAGSISPASQYFNASTVVPVTALANGGNEFEFWSGACTGSATCSVTMNAPVTVTANFAAPSTWVQLGPATSPSARTLAATASDPVRQQVVVFGGAIDGQDQVYTNETWVWNGTTWTQMHPVNSPPARVGAAMAWDPAINQIVLFGGLGSNYTNLNDTWFWDGSNWTQKLPATSPSARRGGRLAYDGSWLVLFGGLSNAGFQNDTWVWNPLSSTWVLRSPSQSPPARWYPGMTYDSAHSQIVLFGGQGASTYNDTWVWNGTTWTQKSPVNPPPARSNAMLAYDAAIQQTVLFSGLAPSNTPTFPNEVWLWDGANWVQRAESPSPYRRFDSAMVYDDARQQIVLFGGDSGIPGTDVPLNDTWVFGNNVTQQSYTLTLASNPGGAGTLTAVDSAGQSGPAYRAGSVVTVTASANALTPFAYWSGGCTGSGVCTVTMTGNLTVTANYIQPLKWTQLGPANSPPGRVQGALAFDGGRGEAVLFGGWTGFSFLNDTWSWDGTNWTLRNSAGPGGRELPAMAYDPVHQQMILFGGATSQTGPKLNDTWLWNGASSTWTQLHPATQPAARETAMLGWDGSKLILFGGDGAGEVRLNDTWTWNGSNWVQLFPANSPPIRSDAAFTYDAARNQLVLFGGINAGSYLGDTWVWNGSNWMAKSPAVSPSARDNLEMLNYDPVIQQSVLFAGLGQAYPPEVWLWDGNNWTEVPESPSPQDRDFHSMVFDPVHQQLLLFGGYGELVYSDTWVFDNTSVQQYFNLSLAVNPPGSGTVTATELTGAVNQPGPTYRAGSLLQLVASSTPALPFEYWSGACTGGGVCQVTMNANTAVTANYPAKPAWIQLGPANAPPSRDVPSLAFDSARGEAVLFGGYGAPTDTWIWDGTNWNRRVTATAPSPRYAAAMAYDVAHHVTVLFGGAPGNGVLLGDTWLWDGASSTWTQVTPAHAPSARASAQLAWDGARLILFGGNTTAGASAETWAWTGSDWSLLSPAAAPPARYAHSMAYDPVRNQIVLFGGKPGANYLGDTWVWKGSTWQQIPTPNALTGRASAAMGFQGAIQKMVLFSGLSSSPTNDTWLFDGATWQPSSEAIAPAVQWYSAIAYDSAHQQTLLFSHYAGDYGETWIYANNAVQQYATLSTTASPSSGGAVTVQAITSAQAGPSYRVGSNLQLTASPAFPQEFDYWTGACAGSNRYCTLVLNSSQSATANFGLPLSWLQLNPATNASPKVNLEYQNPISMAFDALHQQVVYFGGLNGTQTWVWNGSTWMHKTPVHSPPARSGHALAYDAARQRIVLFGGGNGSVALNDTWTWDGTDWTLADPGNGPAKRFNHAMAYDRVRQQIVLFGGVDENLHFYTDTWVWNGSAWTQMPVAGPPARTDFGMVFDPVVGAIVISGGLEGQHDTWEWNGSMWTQMNPAHLPPAVGGFLQMAYDEHLERSILVMDNYPNAPQTWMWDGADWTQLSPAQSPTPRTAGGIVWDGVRNQVILFGGDAGNASLSDTWALAPPTVVLTLQSVTVAKDGSGNYLVSTTLKNTGNTTATTVDATSATIAGPATVTSTTFPSGQFNLVAPGATTTIVTKFPAGTGTGVYGFAIQGQYGSVNVSAGPWSAALRTLVLL